MFCPLNSSTLERSEILTRLAEIFNGIPASRLSDVAAEISLREVAEGQILIQEGTQPTGVFMVMRGRFGIFTQDSNAHIVHVRVVTEPGALLGEQSARDEHRVANASVIALAPSQAAHIPAKCFRALLASDTDAASRLHKSGLVQVLEKMQALSAEMAEMARMAPADLPTSRQFSYGSTIYRAGDAPSSAFFVLSGQVNLLPPGCPLPHENVGPGIIFGEAEVISGAPRLYDAIAASPTDVLEIPREVLLSGNRYRPEVGTFLKALSFVHDMPHLGTAYRFMGEAEGRSCIVTDYAQADGRRVRVRYFPKEQKVEAATAGADVAADVVSTPDGSATFLLSDRGNRLAGLTARQDWPGLSEAMAVLLRGGALQNWQIAALRSDGRWLSEAASERAIGGSEIVCACTNASVTRLRLAAQGVDTVEELMRKTGAGTVCGGCRGRLPLMLGVEESVLCRLETKALCPGAVCARLVPAVGGSLPVALPGQHVRVEALLDERWVGRPYTLTDFGPEQYELGVKIEEGGLFSNWICHAPKGSLVRISPPQGNVCPSEDDPRTLVYVVAGIGVTTAIAAVRAFSATRPMVVHYVYRHEVAAPYLAELREAAKKQVIELHETETSKTGRPSPESLTESLRRHAPCQAIACGPEQFNLDLLRLCEDMDGVEAVAESFLHPQRGEGVVPRPGSWRIPRFCPSLSGR